MPPIWLTVVSLVSIGLAFVCAGAILYDVFGRGYRQHMRVMEAVWPITALYFGPLALWAYRRWGRPMSHKWMEEHGDPPKKSQGATTAVGTSHCGAGCTLGDIIGSPLVVFVLGWQIAGMYLYAEYVVDYALAFVLGIAFQYYAIKPMRGLSPREGFSAALKADFLSLTSFQVGLYAWMAVMQLVLFPGGIHPDRAAFWFLMQIGMILGFATSYPVNWWLIRGGIKEAM
ncbi:MAG: DUF4396 domain-containing protein [Actinomycetota bacterium]|nr:DUF4396 domain-containing protein [Actinomycetota bacterium]